MNEEIEKPRQALEVLWTPKQIADYFTVSVRTVYGWIREGTNIKPNKIIRIGNKVRIARSEIERLAGNIRTQIQNK